MDFHFQRAARFTELESDIPHAVTLADGRRVCLVKTGEKVYAFIDQCPHKAFALSGGDMVAPCVLECAWHGARFDIRSGKVMQGPATDALTTYSVRIVGDEVFVGPQRG